MPDYDFNGLSPRSFEQMVQALCCKILGHGVVIFGDGPDGGREATFTGPLAAFPSASASWDGYVVVQAKFRQRPSSKRQENAQWVLKELRKELDVFTKAGSKRKKPEYYILATNVVLTPAAKTGTKDIASQLVAKYKKRLGLRDHRIWDYDQICRYLDADEEVRDAYRAWTTPGDVLAKLSARLEQSFPDATKVMVNFLQKELLDDHYSKLEQAGHSPEKRVPLEQVFVDLPSFPERRSEAPEEGGEGKPLPPGFLAAILGDSGICLRGNDKFANPAEKRSHAQPEPGRHVLIGGPGQGKSTLAQFLCQIHRANLLRGRKGLDPDAGDAVRSINDLTENQGLDASRARRFPLRIDLARFAKTLATRQETKVTSVLSYLAHVIRERTDYIVTAEALREWLVEYPWLVVLDGLDEVPASSNRTEVLDAIKDFQVDIASCNGDVFILATTRPQGYNDEFSPRRYLHSWLAPLSTARSLQYGTTLINRTYQHDTQRRKEVQNRLVDAAKVPATARLMESPLQVTIMARLLAQVAKPPQERYRLFQQYYEVIYRREMERGVPVLSQLLRDYEADVNAIHHRTGLLLQIESERTQHTDATLTMNDFKSIVRNRLDKEGHLPEVRTRLADEIVKCATDRLVFLVPSQSERVGFEIRSLQEFMAAEALMRGRDEVVVRRMKTIAAVPYWQNVFLFAAGKCFWDRQWLRDSIAQICAEMNDDPADELAHHLLAGSWVALALLEDGPSRRQPAYSQALARRALSLLDLPPSEIHDRLADVYEQEFETVYREEIERRFSLDDFSGVLSSWRVLLRLHNRKGVSWAREMAEAKWPSSTEQQSEIVRLADITDDQWLCKKYEERFFSLPFSVSATSFRHHIDKSGIYRLFGDKRVSFATMLAGRWWDIAPTQKAMLDLGRGPAIGFRYYGLDASRELLSPFINIDHADAYWIPLTASARFAANPTKEELGRALGEIAEQWNEGRLESVLSYNGLPWPLASCVAASRTQEELRLLSNKATCGAMGETRDWKAAEKRWNTVGLNRNDVQVMDDEHWPIPHDIARVGFPFGAGGIFLNIHELAHGYLEEFWRSMSGQCLRSMFAPVFLHLELRRYGFSPERSHMRRPAGPPYPPLSDVLSALDGKMRFPLEILAMVMAPGGDPESTIRLLNLLGMKSKGFYSGMPEFWSVEQKDEDIDARIVGAANANVSLKGLCLLLSSLAEVRRINRIPDCVPSLVADSDQSFARAGVVLSLCKAGVPNDEVRRIADTDVNRLFNDRESLQRLLSVVRNNLIDSDRAWPILQSLWDRIPAVYVEARARMLDLMVVLLGRRVTRLQEEAVWRDLDLPLGLHQVLRRETK